MANKTHLTISQRIEAKAKKWRKALLEEAKRQGKNLGENSSLPDIIQALGYSNMLDKGMEQLDRIAQKVKGYHPQLLTYLQGLPEYNEALADYPTEDVKEYPDGIRVYINIIRGSFPIPIRTVTGRKEMNGIEILCWNPANYRIVIIRYSEEVPACDVYPPLSEFCRENGDDDPPFEP